jgi:ATP-dependent DNA ligase
MAKQHRYINPQAHRPVNWDEAAVQRALNADGYLIAQVKEDGIRFHAFIDAAGLHIVTREGIEIRSLEQRKEALRGLLEALPVGFVVDGEVVVQGVTFEAGSGILRRHELVQEPVLFYVWDAFPLAAITDGLGACTSPYGARFALLCSAGKRCGYEPTVVPIRGRSVTSLEEAQDFFNQCRENDKEGAVLKRHTLPVRTGKVTGQWKMKPSDTVDGIIRGLVWGTPGLGNEGKIIGFTVELESGVLCDVTGLTQEDMTRNTDHYNMHDQDAQFIGRYCEVAYMEMTANGSLRHPSFVQFRDLDYAPGMKS